TLPLAHVSISIPCAMCPEGCREGLRSARPLLPAIDGAAGAFTLLCRIARTLCRRSSVRARPAAKREDGFMRGIVFTLVLAGLGAGVLGAEAPAQSAAPKRGGVLNFAVVAEPPNYDCHANTTFGVLHPVGPHYSTLLKYTGDWKSMRIEP